MKITENQLRVLVKEELTRKDHIDLVQRALDLLESLTKSVSDLQNSSADLNQAMIKKLSESSDLCLKLFHRLAAVEFALENPPRRY